jgi:hypothetical protein
MLYGLHQTLPTLPQFHDMFMITESRVWHIQLWSSFHDMFMITESHDWHVQLWSSFHATFMITESHDWCVLAWISFHDNCIHILIILLIYFGESRESREGREGLWRCVRNAYGNIGSTMDSIKHSLPSLSFMIRLWLQSRMTQSRDWSQTDPRQAWSLHRRRWRCCAAPSLHGQSSYSPGTCRQGCPWDTAAAWCRRCKPTSADTHACPNMGQQHAVDCSALDTSRRMQEHAKLEIRAYTCRPSIRACTCMVLIHADAYSHTLWTNAEWYMWNMREPIWMENERANMNETQFSSYAAHDYDPNMLTCRPSKHVPCVYLECKSLYNGRRVSVSNRKV